MKSMTLRSRVGEDEMLNLQLTLDITNSDLEVVVIVQPLPSSETTIPAQASGWIPEFFEEVLGSWKGVNCWSNSNSTHYFWNADRLQRSFDCSDLTSELPHSSHA